MYLCIMKSNCISVKIRSSGDRLLLYSATGTSTEHPGEDFQSRDLQLSNKPFRVGLSCWTLSSDCQDSNTHYP